MRTEAGEADLILCLGGSLQGTTADLINSSVARRSQKGRSLGVVLVRTQESSYDGAATLRFNCSNDHMVKLLVDRCAQCTFRYLTALQIQHLGRRG